MATEDEGVQRLRTLLLSQAAVDKVAVDFIITTLDVKSVADLANLWVRDTYLDCYYRRA